MAGKLIMTVVVMAISGFLLMRIWRSGGSIDFYGLAARKADAALGIQSASVIVQPSRLSFEHSVFEQSFPVEIVNITQETRYEIWLKITRVGGGAFPADDLKLQSGVGLDLFSKNEPASKPTLPLDEAFFHGFDAFKAEATYLLFYALKGGERLTLKATRKANSKPLSVQFEIKAVSNQPSAIISGGTGSGVSFTIPEDFTLTHIGRTVRDPK